MLSISLSADFEAATLTAKVVAGSTGRFVSSDASKSSSRVPLVGYHGSVRSASRRTWRSVGARTRRGAS